MIAPYICDIPNQEYAPIYTARKPGMGLEVCVIENEQSLDHLAGQEGGASRKGQPAERSQISAVPGQDWFELFGNDLRQDMILSASMRVP